MSNHSSSTPHKTKQKGWLMALLFLCPANRGSSITNHQTTNTMPYSWKLAKEQLNQSELERLACVGLLTANQGKVCAIQVNIKL
jgi:hypothetical protein